MTGLFSTLRLVARRQDDRPFLNACVWSLVVRMTGLFSHAALRLVAAQQLLQDLSQQHQLAQMIGIVIGGEQRFAQQRLTLAVRDAREELLFAGF